MFFTSSSFSAALFGVSSMLPTSMFCRCVNVCVCVCMCLRVYICVYAYTLGYEHVMCLLCKLCVEFTSILFNTSHLFCLQTYLNNIQSDSNMNPYYCSMAIFYIIFEVSGKGSELKKDESGVVKRGRRRQRRWFIIQ